MNKPATANNRIIVALDVPSYAQAAHLVNLLYMHVGGFAVSDELLLAAGPSVLALVRETGAKVMLDTNLHAIPTAMAASARAAAEHRVDFFTVHASAGPIALKAVASELRAFAGEQSRFGGSAVVPKALATTVLTSLSGADAQVIYHRSLDELLHDFAHLAVNAGMGLVCSPNDLVQLRLWERTKQATIVTPGVRPTWFEPGDQKRFTTPFDAIRDGADYLVIGRPIIAPPAKMGSPVHAARRIAEEIEAGMAKRRISTS